MDALLALVGLLGGLLLSALFWWVLAHRVVPCLEFSSSVSKRPDRAQGRVVYRVKVQNTSHRRGVIDITFRARVVMPKQSLLEPGVAQTTSIVDIPLDVDHLFHLNPRGDRILWLDFGGSFNEDWRPYLPAAVCESLANSEDGGLEALLSLPGDPTLRLQALAFDEFSGARKFYESKEYRTNDIVEGRFRGLDVEPSPPSP
jgi:hypothetical protein